MSEGMANIGTPLKESMERTPKPDGSLINEGTKKPEQEPEWYHGIDVYGCNRFYHKTEDRTSEFNTPLYTTPPQSTWVGLTDEEILAVNMSTVTKLIDEPIVCDTDHNIIQLGKAIEAKLKEKNT